MLDALAPRSAFHGFITPSGTSGSPGIVVQELRDVQLATVIARSAREPLSERLQAVYGLALPSGPRRETSERLALLGTGPRTWLALRHGGEPLAPELAGALGDAAAVTDQSDGYGLLRLSGPKVRALLEKGLAVDVHARAFQPGDVAVTICSHIGVIVWPTDEAPTFELAVFRSYAGSLWYWLADSAAEFGLAVS